MKKIISLQVQNYLFDLKQEVMVGYSIKCAQKVLLLQSFCATHLQRKCMTIRTRHHVLVLYVRTDMKDIAMLGKLR